MSGLILFFLLTIKGCYGNASMFICGTDHIEYDISTHYCSNNSVYPKIEIERKPEPIINTSSANLFPERTTSSEIIEHASFLCRTNRQHLLPMGIGCCKDVWYRPEIQTCCRQSDNFKVFNVPERNHICCHDVDGFIIYLRGSNNVICRDASTNNNFFSNVELFESSNIARDDVSRICMEKRLVFRIKVVKGRLRENTDHLHYVKLSAWRFSPFVRNGKISRFIPPNGNNRIEISLNKHPSTVDRLYVRPFLVLTNFDYFSQEAFLLNPDENLYKFPKNVRSLKKRLNRLSKICRRMIR